MFSKIYGIGGGRRARRIGTSVLSAPAEPFLIGVSALNFSTLFFGGVPSADTFNVSDIESRGVYAYLREMEVSWGYGVWCEVWCEVWCGVECGVKCGLNRAVAYRFDRFS